MILLDVTKRSAKWELALEPSKTSCPERARQGSIKRIHQEMLKTLNDHEVKSSYEK